MPKTDIVGFDRDPQIKAEIEKTRINKGPIKNV
jgi:hypothetical protein